MVRKEDFLEEFNGHANAYSSYMVFNVGLDELIEELNNIDPDMCVGSGCVAADSSAVYFEVCKEGIELLVRITKDLSCTGFTDNGGWYGKGWFAAYKDGEEYDDFTAAWTYDGPERREEDFEDGASVPDEEMTWDSFVTVTDNATGIDFCTGEGAVDYETMLSWKSLVENHKSA